MENSDFKKQILKNEELRTEEFISLENYFSKLLAVLEKEWQTEKKVHNWDYQDYCNKFLQTMGVLNKQLREIKEEINKNIEESTGNIGIKHYSKTIDNILSLEEKNYKLTISIFLQRLANFELLKKDADEEEFTNNEKVINEYRITQKEVRESINDIITTIKYSA